MEKAEGARTVQMLSWSLSLDDLSGVPKLSILKI